MTAEIAPGPAPISTYRIQLTPERGFRYVAQIAPYLAALGISHVYLSPITSAGLGSTHGYDVVDHSRVSAELGGLEAFRDMTAALQAAGLGQVVDIVPNHMAIGPGNAWWWDVLENGPSSRFAGYFDVDWDPPEAKLRNTVLLPILGDHYGRTLDRGEIRLSRTGGTFTIDYGEQRMPVAPRSLDSILSPAAALSSSDALAFLARSHRRLPPSTATDGASVQERHRDKEVLHEQLAKVLDDDMLADAVDRVVEDINRDPEQLHELLERQNYRLAHWRTAGEELDYRRFFDVTTLVGLRVEDPEVFDAAHDLIISLVAEGAVAGLRVDHIDGLQDPAAYLRRLRQRVPDTWVVVEKILEGEEELPQWPVAGTTGYEFANLALRLLVDPQGVEAITRGWMEMTGLHQSWTDVALGAKAQVMDELLAADVTRLAAQLTSICEAERHYRDFTRRDCRAAIQAVLQELDVYRTYLDDGEMSEVDRSRIDRAVERAGANAEVDADLLELLGAILRGDASSRPQRELAQRFQQVSGPVMAKAIEDTAFYRYTPLVALNEVGGDPDSVGVEPKVAHAALAHVAQRWPATMLNTATHDTKRGEDTRARLAVLSERPGEWAAALSGLMAACRDHRPPLLDPATEALFHQTVVGAWPVTAERMVDYMAKATREAKVHTSWLAPNGEYDEQLASFVARVLGDSRYTDLVTAEVDSIRDAGWSNSLAQTLLRLTAPGVPDTYQGTEGWDLSLVDPDNRRPVDHAALSDQLGQLEAVTAEECWRRRHEGWPKLLVTARALATRRDMADCFAPGAGYEPIEARGSRADHAFAFLRGRRSVTLVTRLPWTLGGEWGDTCIDIPEGLWTDVLTGRPVPCGEVRIADVLDPFPVALFVLGSP